MSTIIPYSGALEYDPAGVGGAQPHPHPVSLSWGHLSNSMESMRLHKMLN